MREHHPIGHPRHEMWFELAKIMEQAAIANSDLQPQILATARAYQAAVPRPDVDESV
jgi:hypothetical protein